VLRELDAGTLLDEEARDAVGPAVGSVVAKTV
jgi:hypothetical protein